MRQIRQPTPPAGPISVARGALLGIVSLAAHFSTNATLLLAADALFWRRVRVSPRFAALLALVATSAIVEILVTHFSSTPQPGIERTAFFGMCAIGVGAIIGSDQYIDQRRALVSFAFVVLATNLLFLLLGFTGQSVYLQSVAPNSVMLPGLRRVQFFFAHGINSYGTLAGLFLTVAMVDFLSKRARQSLVVAVLAAITVLLTDSRGALVAAILTILVAQYSHVFALPRLAILFTVAAMPLLLLLGPTLNSLFAFAIRADGLDLTTGRSAYWSTMISRLPDHLSNWWFGFGLMGPSRLDIPLTNLSQLSLYLKQADVLPHAHNIWLQIFLEGGLFKTAVVLWLFMSAAAAAGRIEDQHKKKFILSFLYVPIAGMTESTFDYLRIEMLIFTFTLCGMALNHSVGTKE